MTGKEVLGPLQTISRGGFRRPLDQERRVWLVVSICTVTGYGDMLNAVEWLAGRLKRSVGDGE